MNTERVRGLLGVWMPMVIGLWIIATAVLFYFTADLSSSGVFKQNLESWRFVCSAGVFFVGGLMILSTSGRYQKAKAARREESKSPRPPPPSSPEGERDPSKNG